MTALVTDNLPLLAAATGGVAKLRTLILELAIRGKLLPQNLSDESAETLLREARVVGKKAQANHKASTPIPDHVPFPLPRGWTWARFNDLIDPAFPIAYGVLVPGPEVADGVPFVRIADLDLRAPRVRPEKTIARKVDAQFARTRLKGGEILMGVVGSVGKLGVAPDSWAGANIARAICRIVPSRTISKSFVLWVLQTEFMRIQFLGDTRTLAQPTLNVGLIREALTPVPPLAEQYRIVAKVDELMALCDRLEAEQADAEAAHAKLVKALLASLTQAGDAADFRAGWQHLAEHFHTLFTTEESIDALKQTVVHLAVMGKLVAPAEGEAGASVFLAEIEAARSEYEATPGLRTRQRADQREPMAPPPYSAPAGWEWRNLGSLLLITGGVTLGRKLAGRELVSLPYLRVANVQRGFLVLDQVKEIEVPADEVAKYALAPGDLLTTEGGDWDKVGRTAIWQGEVAKCLHQNHVFRSRPYTDTFSSRWVELYLNSPPARDYFAGSSKQTTNLASINMTQLRACAFPVPPLAEQQRIVAVVDDLLERCDQLKVSMALAMQQHEHLASVLVEQAVA